MTDLELQSHLADSVYQSSTLSARLVDLARYLVKFHPGPRRSISTQTDAD